MREFDANPAIQLALMNDGFCRHTERTQADIECRKADIAPRLRRLTCKVIAPVDP